MFKKLVCRWVKKAFEDDSMGEAQIKFWYWRFKDGRESDESGPRSGRPVTSGTTKNVEHTRAAVNENWWLTVQELEEDLGFHRLLFQRFWQRILARNVWWQNLFHGSCQKSRRNFVLKVQSICLKPLTMSQISSKKVITRDESRVYGCDPETKTQSSQWKSPESPRPKKAQQTRSNIKAMMMVVFLS